jgi:nucleoside 2-deoxyribosyltransferase
MTKHLKIYLAGKMTGLSFEEMNLWRNKIKGKLQQVASYGNHKLSIINPVDFYNFQSKNYQSEEEVEDYDLAHVISSDIIIVNLDGLNTSIGTIIELHDANYHHRIPVIALGSKEDYDNLHPWIKRDITRVEETMDDIVDYIENFYMI